VGRLGSNPEPTDKAVGSAELIFAVVQDGSGRPAHGCQEWRRDRLGAVSGSLPDGPRAVDLCRCPVRTLWRRGDGWLAGCRPLS
jgi:hypothetical protein